ncbi:MBL fold metallo-hydrolase [Paraoerskovia sediminicola]|uniref:MBL fold metallo-hydrolase n=1 Tax=Paraoerskovia sediminicola TaxID=1138587 RepID=A0ABM8G519_9CELL|nr:MBL fold metallo-hydrolase [Paraoerskovia sediminicola]BDZ43145.1 MBL fold metallo-hydrolase [Paraoerskovia sediminicola]
MTAIEKIRPGIWSVAIPMPGSHLPYSLAYLIEDGAAVHVVDPGLGTEEGWAALTGGLAAAGHGVADIATVTLTHLHPDHLGLADQLRDAGGATVAMHSADVEGLAAMTAGHHGILGDESGARSWGVPAARLPELLAVRQIAGPQPTASIDVRLADGDRLAIGDRHIEVVHTPGHTAGSICLIDRNEGLVWTGDHVLPGINPGLGLGGPTTTHPPADYLSSLDVVRRLDDPAAPLEVLPGHGAPFTGLAARCDALAAHQQRRADEVAAVLADDGGASVWSVASRLTWTAGWARLEGFLLASALAQTAMLVAYVRQRADLRPDGR